MQRLELAKPTLHQPSYNIMKTFIRLLFLMAAAARAVAASQEASLPAAPLRVIFCGLGRTGSHSLAAALERLGFKPCHGSNVVNNILGSHKALADAITQGSVQGVLNETAALGYDATLEIHSAYCPEIYQNRQLYAPEAKFVFTLRGFDSWFSSFVNMFKSVMPLHRYPLRLFPLMESRFQSLARLQLSILLGGGANQEDLLSADFITNLEQERVKQRYRDMHTKNRQFALKTTAADPTSAFLLDLKELNSKGYTPLCDFLGILPEDCPKEPYPRLGSAGQFRNIQRVLLAVEVVLYALIVGIGYGLCRLARAWTTKSKID